MFFFFVLAQSIENIGILLAKDKTECFSTFFFFTKRIANDKIVGINNRNILLLYKKILILETKIK